MKNIVPILLGIIVISSMGVWYMANSKQRISESVPNPVVATTTPGIYELKLVKRVLTPDIVTVKQGDEVTVNLMSDETGEFHVSGYEIENEMEAGKPLSFSFAADKPGRYNFELHPLDETGKVGDEDLVVGAFVVNPE